MNAAGRVPMMIAVCVVLAALCEAPAGHAEPPQQPAFEDVTRAAGVGHRITARPSTSA